MAAACRSKGDSADASVESDIGPIVAPAALAARLDDVKNGKIVVLYVRPASAALKELGRPNARVLDLPTRFATDWTDKGYAVERS